MRSWLSGLVLGAGVLAAVGAALFIIRPWESGQEEPVVAAYGVCNVSLESIPKNLEVVHHRMANYPDELPTKFPFKWYMFLLGPEPAEPVASITDPDNRSRVAIDAETGDIAFEFYKTDEEKARFAAALEGMNVGPWEADGPAWPRTDTIPRGAVVTGNTAFLTTVVTYRKPDEGAGFMARHGHDASDRIHVSTCDSSMVINRATGEVVGANVVPEELAMFDRFLAEVSEPIPVLPRVKIGDRWWLTERPR